MKDFPRSSPRGIEEEELFAILYVGFEPRTFHDIGPTLDHYATIPDWWHSGQALTLCRERSRENLVPSERWKGELVERWNPGSSEALVILDPRIRSGEGIAVCLEA